MPDAENTTPYREVTEAEATEAGLPGQPDTTYMEHDGETYAYNAGTRCCWKVGKSPLGHITAHDLANEIAQQSPPDVAEDDRSVEDRENSAIGGAVDKAQNVLRAGVEISGGRVLCSLVIVHADGVSPDGAMEVYVDPDGGPQDPEDVLAFALNAVGALAKRYGLPFAVMEAGAG